MNKQTRTTFFIISGVLILIRLAFISNTMLIDDEAYYAMYARHLAWGYIDHGPVVAFLIKLFTIFSENAFMVRVGPIVLITILTIILYRFGKSQFNEATGMALSLGLSANMLFHTNAVVMTPDVPLAFFSILAILYYYKAFFIDEKYLIAAGAMLGLAMLSKISALFPAIGIVLFPAIVKEKRHFYKNVNFYLSLILALLIFMPFVVWNLQNDLAFVKYQGAHVSKAGSFSDFLGLWMGFLLATGPIYFYYAVIHPIWVVRNFRAQSIQQLYFLSVTGAPLIYFIAQSLHSRMEMNWLAPILSGGLFLFGLTIGEHWTKYKNRFYFQIIFSLLLIGMVTIQTFLPFLPVKGKNDVTNRYFIFSSFPDELKTYLEAHPELQDKRILANNFQIPSMVNFYIKPKLEASCLSIGYHETLYSFIHSDKDFRGDEFLFIAKGNSIPASILPYFANLKVLHQFQSTRDENVVAKYSLWLATNYKGKET
jgi:4-amino-4-deoxy-L-arabinose transferase-like glycosyltransferase